MPGIRLTGFSGLIPKIAKRLLPDTGAQIAANCKLWSGEIEPIKDSELTYTSTKSGPLNTGLRLLAADGVSDVWLAWDEDVNAVRGPIPGDTSQRTYYTGVGEPSVTNLTLAIQGGGNNYPASSYVLGLPAPEIEPTVSPSGGVGASTTRSYVYTFLSRTTLPDGASLDEEGPPSPVKTANGKVDDTWAIGTWDATPPNSGTISGVENSQPSAGYVRVALNTVKFLRAGERITFSSVGGMTDLNETFGIVGVDAVNGKVWVALTTAQTYTSGGTWARAATHNTSGMKRRIYRTDAAGTYRVVAEIDVATSSYNDTIADTVLATKSPLVSTSYYQPPADMHSIIALPNETMAGISKNQLCFSEPGQPHAWPPEYRRTANYDGVSLGNVGTMVVMTTTGRHYVAHGTDPATVTMDESKGRPYPCVSKRSTVSMENGVVWATHDGAAIQTPQGSALFTEGVFEYEEWQALGPDTMFGALYSGRYVAGFQRPGSDVQELLILDPSEQAFMVLAGVQASGLYSDIQNGQLYVLLGTNVRKWDSDIAARLSADWMSKEFVVPSPTTMTAAKVDADFSLTPEEQNALAAERATVIAANQALLVGVGWIGGEVNDDDVNDIDVNDSPLAMVPAATYDQLWFYFYVDGAIKYAKQVQSNQAFRLPSGYKTDAFAVRVISNIRVKAILFATSMEELKRA